MNIDFRVSGTADDNVLGDVSSAISEVWKLAADDFFSRHVSTTALKKKNPLGMQPFLNRRLNRELPEAGWDGGEGRFRKGNTWFRVTFRHGMSLGSDFMDGLLLAHRENIEMVVIAAPSRDFASLITPRDAAAIVTFEKLEEYFSRVKSLFQIPLSIGRLSEGEGLDAGIRNFLATRA